MNDKNKIPKIYVYRLTDPRVDNLVKVGYTIRDIVGDRVREQFGSRADIYPPPYELLHYEDAITNIGEKFTDRDVHAELMKEEVENVVTSNGKTSEFFVADLETIINAISSVKKKTTLLKGTEISTDSVIVKDLYIDRPLTTDIKEMLCEDLNLVDNNGRMFKWRGVKSKLIDVGYEIEDKTITIDGRRRRVSIITEQELS